MSKSTSNIKNLKNVSINQSITVNNDLQTSSNSTTRKMKNTHVSRINFDHFNAETSKSVGSIDRSNSNDNLLKSVNTNTGVQVDLKSIDGIK